MQHSNYLTTRIPRLPPRADGIFSPVGFRYNAPVILLLVCTGVRECVLQDTYRLPPERATGEDVVHE